MVKVVFFALPAAEGPGFEAKLSQTGSEGVTKVPSEGLILIAGHCQAQGKYGHGVQIYHKCRAKYVLRVIWDEYAIVTFIFTYDSRPCQCQVEKVRF